MIAESAAQSEVYWRLCEALEAAGDVALERRLWVLAGELVRLVAKWDVAASA